MMVIRRAADVKAGKDLPPEAAIGLDVTEEERQMLLLALAHLSVERPGWDAALNRLALKFDEEHHERAHLFDEFRKVNGKKIAEAKRALEQAMEMLPVCQCGELATHTRFDAAGDPWPSCRPHATVGGMLGDSNPVERAWVAPLREAKNILESLKNLPVGFVTDHRS